MVDKLIFGVVQLLCVCVTKSEIDRVTLVNFLYLFFRRKFKLQSWNNVCQKSLWKVSPLGNWRKNFLWLSMVAESPRSEMLLNGRQNKWWKARSCQKKIALNSCLSDLETYLHIRKKCLCKKIVRILFEKWQFLEFALVKILCNFRQRATGS